MFILKHISLWIRLFFNHFHLFLKGKRFHATVSFDADTRLKEAIATVKRF